MNPPQVYMCSPSWTLLPPPSPFHPTGSSQCTSPKHLVSCIEPGLATRFIHDILHVSMPFSQIFQEINPVPTGLISFRIDWFDLIAVQGSLNSPTSSTLWWNILWWKKWVLEFPPSANILFLRTACMPCSVLWKCHSQWNSQSSPIKWQSRTNISSPIVSVIFCHLKQWH